MKLFKTLLLGVAALSAAWTDAGACSRVVYLGDDGLVLVGRTLDWRTPIPTNLYVYPQGIQKASMPSGPRLEWTSRYGSVLAVGYDGGVTEGMNEKGLTVNGLFCKTAVYTAAPKDSDMPVMSLALFISYFLDNFATVAEADAWLDTNSFGIWGQTFDGGTVSTLHWALTDASGETLLLEYVDGKLNRYRGRELQVLTNDPDHPQMMAIEKYWEAVNGVNMLTGTDRSA
ncbi:MAG: linear amide C-N hydrolase, partial [Muribaculaceae bacterium]|nr:linear amide C-N hydrolase [Muribaculaceae bacterium]